MRIKSSAYLGAAAGAVLSLAGGWTATASATTLTGAGSTLVAPLEGYWNTGWQSVTGNSVGYSAVGPRPESPRSPSARSTSGPPTPP